MLLVNYWIWIWWVCVYAYNDKHPAVPMGHDPNKWVQNLETASVCENGHLQTKHAPGNESKHHSETSSGSEKDQFHTKHSAGIDSQTSHNHVVTSLRHYHTHTWHDPTVQDHILTIHFHCPFYNPPTLLWILCVILFHALIHRHAHTRYINVKA